MTNMLPLKKQLALDSQVQSVWSKAKRFVIGLAILSATGAAIYAFILINAWFDNNRFRAPVVVKFSVKFQSLTERRHSALNIPLQAKIRPVMAAEPTPPAPHFTEKDIVLSYAHGEMLWKIYQLESGRGKADYCRLEGKGFGGFGVLSDGKIVCYDTFSLAAERAEYWLVQNGIDNDIPSTLCKWSGYGAIQTCPYYKTYLSL